MFVRAAALAALCLSSVLAQAQEFKPAFQAGIDIGRSNSSSTAYDADSDGAVGLALGYRFHPNIAAEVFFRGLRFSPLANLGAPDAYVPEEHIGIAALGYVPLGERFRAYGRVGVGRTKLEFTAEGRDSRSETDPSLGVGLSLDLGNHFSVTLEGTRFTKTKVNTTVLGLQVRF